MSIYILCRGRDFGSDCISSSSLLTLFLNTGKADMWTIFFLKKNLVVRWLFDDKSL